MKLHELINHYGETKSKMVVVEYHQEVKVAVPLNDEMFWSIVKIMCDLAEDYSEEPKIEATASDYGLTIGSSK